MRALIKFSCLVLLSSMAVGAMSATGAWAGSEGTTPPGSGGVNLDGAFEPSSDSNNDGDGGSNTSTPAAVNAAVTTVLASIASTQSVISPTGESLPLSQEQAATITAALTATGADIRPAIAALEQQLSTELGGLGIEIDVVGATPGNLIEAIELANILINSLSETQLAAALESPTFMAIRAILAGGKDRRGNITATGGSTGLPLLSAP